MKKTYTVYINNLNLLASPTIKDATIPVKISEEEFKKISFIPLAYEWSWNAETKSFELVVSPVLNYLRGVRELECFSYINRSPLWFMNLTTDQQKELTDWYKAWLDVTETGVIPTKPEWLK